MLEEMDNYVNPPYSWEDVRDSLIRVGYDDADANIIVVWVMRKTNSSETVVERLSKADRDREMNL